MAKGSQPKTERNKRILELKGKMTFKALAKMLRISEARVKEIYYKEKKKVEGTATLSAKKVINKQ